MGVDLTIMPVLFRDSWLCHDMLTLDRCRYMWDDIANLGEKPVGQPVQSFRSRCEDGESCYGDMTETPYGTPLTWLPAGSLATAITYQTPKNVGIRAFLECLPSDWPVVLYWY